MASIDISNGNWAFDDANANQVVLGTLENIGFAKKYLYTIAGATDAGGVTVGYIVSGGNVPEQQESIVEWRDQRIEDLRNELINHGTVEDGNGTKFVFGQIGTHHPKYKCSCVAIQPINWLGSNNITVEVEGWITQNNPITDLNKSAVFAAAAAKMAAVANSLINPNGGQRHQYDPDEPYVTGERIGA